MDFTRLSFLKLAKVGKTSGDNSAAINALNTAISNMQEIINTQNTAITELQQTVSSLESRVSALEGVK